MQIVVTVSSDAILGTRSEPDEGGTSVLNGQYVICTPEGVSVEIDSASYVTPQDASSVPGLIAADLLVRNPEYDHVLWNMFVESSDVSMLDLSGAAPAPTALNVVAGTPPTNEMGNLPRCKVGRGGGGPLGISPNTASILPANANRTTPTYGLLITDTIDLTPYTGVGGSDEVMVWWKIGQLDTSTDVVAGYNSTLGLNTPALRELTEIDQEPVGLLVYASVDDGVTWYEVTRMDPTNLVVAGTDLRLAFVNEGSTEIPLLGFIVLIADAP